MWCAPICVSTVAIGAYQYLETFLKLSDILSAMTLFNMLQDPLRSLPYIFNTFNETLISLERIEVIII
jgi:ABC-type multidrug transport system fused ATPase/permease subunit